MIINIIMIIMIIMIITIIIYSGAGSNPNVWMNALNASYLDQIKGLGASVNDIVRQSSPQSKIWVGEAGGAYNSGRDQVTNSFNSGFWFLDQLAIFALNNNGVYCRQSLVGGFYSLLDNMSYQPNPDYYNLLLFSRLMGSKVLQSKSDSPDELRNYAHCTKDRKGSVTVLLINLSNTTSFSIDSIIVDNNNLLEEIREEYIITSSVDADASTITEILGTKNILLNKNPLVITDNKIPNLLPKVSFDKNFNLEPLSYGFIVFPNAKNAACY